jgi:peptidylprolyl isomerase
MNAISILRNIAIVSTISISTLFAQTAILKTTQGDIEIELREDLAPKAVENFSTHIKNGYYNGLIFHRVIKNFMIQTGDPTGTGRGGESIWGKTFEDEFKPNVIFNRAGIVAMANRGPNTNGSQFFITTKPTPWLNGGYTIFGYVKSGMDAVKKIESVKTNGRYGGDRPLKEEKIIEAKIVK